MVILVFDLQIRHERNVMDYHHSTFHRAGYEKDMTGKQASKARLILRSIIDINTPTLRAPRLTPRSQPLHPNPVPPKPQKRNKIKKGGSLTRKQQIRSHSWIRCTFVLFHKIIKHALFACYELCHYSICADTGSVFGAVYDGGVEGAAGRGAGFGVVTGGDLEHLGGGDVLVGEDAGDIQGCDWWGQVRGG